MLGRTATDAGVDTDGKLAGMISDRRLLQALAVPTRAGGEFRRSVEKPPPLTVGDLMNRNVIYRGRCARSLESVAAMMVFNRIGSVAMDEGQAVGIITETDMFHLLRLLGGEERGVRVTLRDPAFRGIQADILTDIARGGGHLVSLGLLPTTRMS